jgi:hypothetical protein
VAPLKSVAPENSYLKTLPAAGLRLLLRDPVCSLHHLLNEGRGDRGAAHTAEPRESIDS